MEDKHQVMLCPLIGLEMRIVSSSSRELVGAEGKAIDETKNLVVLEKGNKIRKITKNGNIFEVLFKGKKTIIKGSEIMFRPEEKAKNIKIREKNKVKQE